MHLQTGTYLQGGRYRIEKVLGQGGFGITYSGIQTNLEAKVAIKEFFMKDLCNRDSDTSQVSVGSVGSCEIVERFRQKFIKEARNIFRLKHKHIISVIDVFEENGTAYYVMEHIGGGSLADKVRAGALPESVAVRYIRQVASALDFVHSRRMMHLDVKPANILLDENDNAVLIDFGLAKQYDSEGRQTSSSPVGISHGYAPLEQYKRGGVSEFSPATDIYSLGATLYKLVTGSTPPEASDVNDDGLPALPLEITTPVREAIEAAMQPRRKDRPQSIEEFLGKLKEQRAKSKTVSFDNIGSDRSQVATTELEPCGLRNTDVVKAADNNNEETRANSSSTLRGEVSRSDGGETELSKVKSESGKVKTASFDSEETRVGINPPRPSATPAFEKVGELSKTDSDDETRANSFSVPEGKEQTESTKKTNKGKILAFIIVAVVFAVVAIGFVAGGSDNENDSYKSDSLSYTSNDDSNSGSNAGAEEHQGISTSKKVDLGLSVCWAGWNVGASAPEDYGDYYAWGETSTKTSYTYDNSSTYGKSMGSIEGNSTYDVARAQWGGTWRLPTKAEFDELCNRCTWTWTTYKGVEGYKVTGPNGNSIFLPAAGWFGSSLSGRGTYGDYWSATPYESNSYYAYYLSFSSGYYYTDWDYRGYGYSVRPVSE